MQVQNWIKNENIYYSTYLIKRALVKKNVMRV